MFVWKLKNFSVKFREREKRKLSKKNVFPSEFSRGHAEGNFSKPAEKNLAKLQKIFLLASLKKNHFFTQQNILRKIYLPIPRIQFWPPWQKVPAKKPKTKSENDMFFLQRKVCYEIFFLEKQSNNNAAEWFSLTVRKKFLK